MNCDQFVSTSMEEVEMIESESQPTGQRDNSDILSLKRTIEDFKKLCQTKREDFEELCFLRSKPETFNSDEQKKQLYLKRSVAECRAPEYQLYAKANHLVDQFIESKLLERMENDLENWEYELKRSYIGFPMTINLLDIKTCAADLYSILWDIRFALRDLEYMHKLKLVDVYSCNGCYNSLLDILRDLQIRLLQITCKLESSNRATRLDCLEPILRVGFKFPLKVSWFVAIDKMIKVCKVTVEIMTEEEAADVVKEPFDPKRPPKTNPVVGILNNNVYSIDSDGRLFPQATKTESNNSITQDSYFSVYLPNFQLTRGTHTSRQKRNNQPETVADKRYCLFVYITVQLDGKECHIWRISTPIVISSYRAQECAAWGNLLWNVGFSRLDEPINSGVMSMKAEWKDILELLDAFHMKIAGHSLGTMQRRHLTSRAKRNGQQIQSYSEMCKRKMDGNSFTFWEWFYNSLNVAKFLPITTENVHGFISKRDAADLLSKMEPLTFVFRYSESMSGGISIVCKSLLEEDMHMAPMTNYQLKRNSIEAKVQNSEIYQFLYPNIPKAEMKFQIQTSSRRRRRPEKQNINYRISPPKRVTFDFGDFINATADRVLQSPSNIEPGNVTALESQSGHEGNQLLAQRLEIFRTVRFWFLYVYKT